MAFSYWPLAMAVDKTLNLHGVFCGFEVHVWYMTYRAGGLEKNVWVRDLMIGR